MQYFEFIQRSARLNAVSLLCNWYSISKTRALEIQCNKLEDNFEMGKRMVLELHDAVDSLETTIEEVTRSVVYTCYPTCFLKLFSA